MMIRLYTETPLAVGNKVLFTPEQNHYLLHVMRCTDLQTIRLFNPNDGEWSCQLRLASKKELFAEVNSLYRPPIQNPLAVKAFLAPLKSKRFDFLLEKLTELGVTEIHPILTDHSHVRDIKAERVQSQLIEASEQCGRFDVPKLFPLQSFSDMCATMTGLLLVGDERLHTDRFTLQDCYVNLGVERSFLIGPEGGFSSREFTCLQSMPHVRFITLGAQILRAETAAIVMAAALTIICPNVKST